MNESASIVVNTRRFRKLHKFIALPVFLFTFLIGITGLLLGWKKQTGLLPETRKSALDKNTAWVSTEHVMAVAEKFMNDSVQRQCTIDRLDYRPKQGVIKVLFNSCFYEIQIDGKSGAVLSHGRRYSDLIERIHDGSILDFLTGDNTQVFKLGYTTWLSISLIGLSLSGFFLWYNPKIIKKRKQNL